jgi:signal transduction histidine kinase
MINLISNALKYTPEWGKVEVRVTGGDVFSQIIVKDSGGESKRGSFVYL